MDVIDKLINCLPYYYKNKKFCEKYRVIALTNNFFLEFVDNFKLSHNFFNRIKANINDSKTFRERHDLISIYQDFGLKFINLRAFYVNNDNLNKIF